MTRWYGVLKITYSFGKASTKGPGVAGRRGVGVLRSAAQRDRVRGGGHASARGNRRASARGGHAARGGFGLIARTKKGPAR